MAKPKYYVQFSTSVMSRFLEDFFPVTTKMLAGYTMAKSIGELIFPFIMAAYVDTWPPIFLWITFFCSATCTLLFAIVAILCKKYLFEHTMNETTKINVPQKSYH